MRMPWLRNSRGCWLSEAVRLERERRKTALALAGVEARRELVREAARVVCDPLWSSILGFVVVHEARQANLVGPVADDLLYSGIIAVNTARSGLAREAGGTLESVLGRLQDTTGTLVRLLPAALGG